MNKVKSEIVYNFFADVIIKNQILLVKLGSGVRSCHQRVVNAKEVPGWPITDDYVDIDCRKQKTYVVFV